MVVPTHAPDDDDRVTYPYEDDVAESVLHLLIRTFLLALVRRWLAANGSVAFTGSDQFIYWVRGNTHRTLAPDLYVLFGVAPASTFKSWKTWEQGIVPRFAMEVVSDDLDKDYVMAPMRYAEMGVDELVLYDPDTAKSADRIRWQVYRRVNGELVQEVETNADRVESRVLGCHLRCWLDAEGHEIVRLATGPAGDDLVLTAEEAALAELEELRRQLSKL